MYSSVVGSSQAVSTWSGTVSTVASSIPPLQSDNCPGLSGQLCRRCRGRPLLAAVAL